jgi:hypothetical protein
MARISKIQPAMSGPGLHAEARSLSIQYRLVRDLRPDPKNPRTHSEKQVPSDRSQYSDVRIQCSRAD